MAKFNLFETKRATLEVAALFVFVLILISNLAIIRFTEGYFAFYNIKIADVSYEPQMYDYLRIALPVILTSIVITILITGVMWLAIKAGDWMAGSTRPNKRAVKFVKNNKRFFVALSSALGLVVKVVIIGVSIVAFWTGLYSVSDDLGRLYAKNQSSVTTISKPDEVFKKVIIYKGNDELILKTYDTSKKEFKNGYQVLHGGNYEAISIDL